jgi:hypothetical protein
MAKVTNKEALRSEHIQTAHKINMQKEVKVPTTLVTVQDFNLLGIQSKIDYLATLPTFHKWVVFINSRANLAHIMHREDTYSYIRMKLPVSLKGCGIKFVEKYFYFRMEGRYIL